MRIATLSLGDDSKQLKGIETRVIAKQLVGGSGIQFRYSFLKGRGHSQSAGPKATSGLLPSPHTSKNLHVIDDIEDDEAAEDGEDD